MRIIANRSETIQVFLYVISCLQIPDIYRGNKSFKFIFKMVRYTKEQRAKIVELYFSCNGSIIAVQRSYRSIFNDGSSPDSNNIKAMVSKFRGNGSTVDKRRFERPRTVRTSFTVQAVSESVAERSNTSIRKRCTQLTMSCSS